MSEYVRCVTGLARPISSRLNHLDLELTERCDNDCVHCCINLPAGDAEARSREMSSEEVKNILVQAADLGCLQVRFTGGEPLLRPDFEELYVFARRLGLKVLVFTNGCLITARLARLWARIPPLVPIEVSAYGMRQQTYEAVSRTPGSFARFQRGLQQLLENRVPFVVKGVVLPVNRAEVEEFEAWTQTLPWMDAPAVCSVFLGLRYRRDDQVKNALIASLRASPAEALTTLARDSARYRSELTEFAARFMGPPGDRLFPCGVGRGISIDAYGRAQACLGLRAPELTIDVRRASLSEALERFETMRELRTTRREYLSRCGVCFLYGLCEQCPAKAWAEHGALDVPVEYFCESAHVQARFMGWLREGERAWDVAEWKKRVF